MDGTLDQQYIIIDATPDITLILEGKLHQIQYLSYPNIHAAADLAKALQTPRPESHFQVGDAQLKAIRGLSHIFDADTKIPHRDAFPTPPRLTNE